MSQTAQIPNVDFTAPRRLTGTASRALTGWQTTACTMLKENWQGLLGAGVGLTPGRVDSVVASKAVRALPDPGYAARLSMGETKFPAICAFSSRVVQTLVADMLGTLGDSWPQDVPLSSAELSMVDLLFGEIARSFSMAWPDLEPLPCHLDSVIVRPLRSRVFAPDEILVRSTIAISTPLGDDELTLLYPKDGLTSLGLTETVPGDTAATVPAPQLRILAERLPITLHVELGSANLSLAEMDSLNIGDVLILDQSVGSPLQATIAGRLHWLGYPCRLGQRQGFRILAGRDR